MSVALLTKRLLGVGVAIGLLAILACGSSDEDATPTSAVPPANTPTSVAVPTFIIPTPTATLAPGATAVPQATATNTPIPAPGEGPLYGGIVTVPGNCGPIDTNSSSTGFCWNGLGLVGNLFSTLIRVNPTDRVTIEGDLAESWSISADGLEYTFKLRPGVVDHEGNPFTAEDAVWQLIRYEERPNGIIPRRQNCIQAYISSIWDENGDTEMNPGAEALDSSTLVIRLDAPRAAFMTCISGAWISFNIDTYYKAIDTAPGGNYRDLDFSKGEVVATGPFKMVDFEQDNFMEFQRFDDFFREGLPYLDGILMPFVDNAATRIALFRANRIDALGVFDNQPSKSDAEELQTQVGDELVAPLINAMGWRGIELNVRSAPFGPIGDPTADKLRAAIQLGLNRQELSILSYDGIGTLATPYFFHWDWINTPEGWYSDLPGFDPINKAANIVKAQGMMAELGYGPNNLFEVESLVTAGSANEAEIQAQWLKENLYWDVTVTNMGTTSAYRARTIPGDFQMVSVESVGASFPDPDFYNLSVFFTQEEGGRNWTSWRNEDWRALHEQQVVLNDPAVRGPILREMAKILYDDAAFVGNNRPSLVHAWRGNWRGYVVPIIHASNQTLEHVWLAK